MLNRYLTDLWADIEKIYSKNAETNETAERNKIHGCIEQIFSLKKKNKRFFTNQKESYIAFIHCVFFQGIIYDV